MTVPNNISSLEVLQQLEDVFNMGPMEDNGIRVQFSHRGRVNVIMQLHVDAGIDRSVQPRTEPRALCRRYASHLRYVTGIWIFGYEELTNPVDKQFVSLSTITDTLNCFACTGMVFDKFRLVLADNVKLVGSEMDYRRFATMLRDHTANLRVFDFTAQLLTDSNLSPSALDCVIDAIAARWYSGTTGRPSQYLKIKSSNAFDFITGRSLVGLSQSQISCPWQMYPSSPGSIRRFVSAVLLFEGRSPSELQLPTGTILS